MKFTHLTVITAVLLCLITVFACVELGLAADLTWELHHRLIGVSTPFRRRTRYIVFCSTWTIVAMLCLVIAVVCYPSIGSGLAVVIVLSMSMIFWLLAAALFTSTINGGLHCGNATFSGGRRLCNITNTTMAFSWIIWSFVMIGLLLSFYYCYKADSQPKPAARGEKIATTTGTASTPRTAPGNAPPPVGTSSV